MRKKILYVITKSNWGGAQRYVYDLATNLPRDRFDVVVALGRRDDSDASYGVLDVNLAEKGIRRIPVESFRRDISFSLEFSALRELMEIFKKEKQESDLVVHLNSSKAGGLGALAARIAGVKNIIFTVHGWPFLENRSSISRILIWLASWLTLLLCHKVICISDYDLQLARRMPFTGKKTIRIYNGIAPIYFESGEKIRNEFPQGVKITGTIGELNKNKNQISLIEQAKQDPSMNVAIIGSGENWIMLEEKIKEYGLKNRVKLLGFVPEAEKQLKGFDTFALPSLKEGLPYVLLEAKMAGLPIVANRIGGIPEILDSKDLHEFSLEKMLTETIKLYQA